MLLIKGRQRVGLSHHWRRQTELPLDLFKKAVSDCRILLDNPSVELAGFDGVGTPVLEDDRIVFNGIAPRSCEPFEIAAVEFDRRGKQEFFSHCKTGHLPYDLYVKATLIVFSHHLQEAFHVSSDQDNQAWDNARVFVQDRLGYGDSFMLTNE